MEYKLYNENAGVKRAEFLKSELGSDFEVKLSKITKTGEPLFFIEIENYHQKVYANEVQDKVEFFFIINTDEEEFSGKGETISDAMKDLKEKIQKNIQHSLSLLKLLNF